MTGKKRIKKCLRCGEPVDVHNDSAMEYSNDFVEYAECQACGFEWEWDGKYLRAWLRDENGNETLSEVPFGCLLVVE